MKWIIGAVVAAPALAVAFYKSSRVLVPEAFGLECEHKICVDDATARGLAASLVDSATQRLKTQHGLSPGSAKWIFCKSARCQRTFGLGQRAAMTVGTFGIVIAPRGWKEHYVAHELIHHWQAECFGNLVLLTGEPWVREGMAYALSDDRRAPLHEPFESYRGRFNDLRRRHPDVPLEELVAGVL